MLLKFLIPGIDWSQAVMAASILAIFPFREKTFLSFKLNGINIVLLAFQLLMIFFWYFSYLGHPDSFRYLFFHLYIIVLVFTINTNKKLHTIEFINVLFFVSSILTLAFSYLHFSGIYAAHRALFLDDSILDVFTMNIATYANLMCCLILLSKKNTKAKVILILLLAILDLYVILISGKRSYFVSIFVALLFWTYKKENSLKTILSLIVIFCFIFVAFDSIRDIFVHMIQQTFAGFNNVFFSSNVSFDKMDSSTYRAINLQKTLSYVDQNYGFLNFIFGYKYLFAWIDNPLLESYLDMGIPGFVLYSYIVILYPIKRLRQTSLNNRNQFVLLMIAIVNITVCITNNNPYEYIAYTPICLLAMYDPKSNKSLNNENSNL